MYVNPRFHNQLKNLVNIDLLTYFLMDISRYLIEVYVQFRVITYHSLTVIACFIIFIWLLIFLNKIRIISFTSFANNIQFVLRLIFKVNFITKSYTMLVFQTWISLSHHFCSCFAIIYRIPIYLSFLTCYILAILHKTHRISHHFPMHSNLTSQPNYFYIITSASITCFCKIHSISHNFSALII